MANFVETTVVNSNLTLDEAKAFLATKRPTRGKPPKAYTEQKKIAMAIVASAKAAEPVVTVVAPEASAPVAETPAAPSAEPVVGA